MFDVFGAHWFLGTFPITCVGKIGPGPLCNACARSKKTQASETYVMGRIARYVTPKSYLVQLCGWSLVYHDLYDAISFEKEVFWTLIGYDTHVVLYVAFML